MFFSFSFGKITLSAITARQKVHSSKMSLIETTLSIALENENQVESVTL